MLDQDIKKVLISHEEIVVAAEKLGQNLAAEYKDKNPIFIGILKGSIPFMAELINHVDAHLETDYMAVSSYQGGKASTGELTIVKDLTADIENRHIVIIEDIIDSGLTLDILKRMFLERNPASLKIVTLLDKPEGRKVEIDADYSCFTIPNEFVVGFGLDYQENYRNLPYIGVLKEEVYK
ncbi:MULTISPECIES: hypoxanthine phosphoribosyltransferase [unclassified Streptococcus]|uniref:hypoxanthine phosphoribosyltransferase n=1 Tax=unclassified Streptococcus TaxID=2608887 RepID=UPI00107189EF|nr:MULTISPECIES: hypoxanthine phosphoribosyltransferase [unclassified Streptococcus]MBF0805835.1 hypoxanthine phosphoribosyltransferase [Streptococcus sp. 19428wA2_WM07]TFU28633.1 hypoxanthine phosphoribosyltransferase [Streptococcus sp. WM07]